MNYRAEIDGLRAIAIMPVILHHADVGYINGGFFGVDVFFVISGYLITSIIQKEISAGTFTFKQFYEKRIRRLFPALYLVLMVSTLAAYLIMTPKIYIEYLQSLFSTIFFISNFYYWLTINYFSQSSEMVPLLHTWSLAIEEQFYLMFPFLLLIGKNLKKNIFYGSLIILFLASLISSNLIYEYSEVANFYLLPSRLWELLLGSMCAFILMKKKQYKSNILSLAGFFLLLIAYFFMDEKMHHPGFVTLLPTIGTCLIILFGSTNTIIGTVLSYRPFVHIGLLSYSLYLIHQPLFAFTRLMNVDSLSILARGGLIIVAIVLAHFMWKFVETPFRSRTTISSRLLAFSAVFFTIIFSSYLFWGLYYSKPTNSGQFNPLRTLHTSTLGAYNANNRELQQLSWAKLRDLAGSQSYGVDENLFDKTAWPSFESTEIRILVVGDSHSKDLYNQIYFATEATKTIGVARYGSQIAKLLNDENFWSSANYSDTTHIIISGRYDTQDLEALPKILRKIISEGKVVSIASRIFEFPGEAGGFNMIDSLVFKHGDLFKYGLVSLINEAYFAYSRNPKNDTVTYINDELFELAAELEIFWFDRMLGFCDEVLTSCSAVSDELEKFIYDYGHLTLAGAQFTGQRQEFVDNLNRFINHTFGK